MTTPENTENPSPTTEPKPAPAPEDKTAELTAQLEAMKKQMSETSSQLESYKKKEQEELNKQKSAEQKLLEKEQEIARLQREKLLVTLGAKKGLDPDLFDRVKGNTEAEIEADIDLLLSKMPKPEEDKTVRGGKSQPGKTEEKPETPELTGIEKENADYFQWRQREIKRR